MMRWFFVDRIESYCAWESITARKAVSFEEFHLLESHGRRGEFPESLLVEACVEAFRWLVVRSSEYRLSAVLQAIEEFSLAAPASCGDVLRVSLAIGERNPGALSAGCSILCSRGTLASGRLSVETTDLDAQSDRSLLAGAWRELYGAA
jgi:hypothetical protein